MSSAAPQVVRHADASAVAQATATRLLDLIVAAQQQRGRAHAVLTGGGVGTASLAAISGLPARTAVDWSRVDLWWGDERFLEPGNPDRNETQARATLLDSLPIPPERVHAMPAVGAGAWGEDPDQAALAYAAELAAACTGGDATALSPVPAFDVVLLGVGPDGHVASLFPEHPALRSDAGVSVVAVRESPKPPPVRVSLTFEAINRAQQVWLLAAGAEKADAVGRALSGASLQEIPAVGVRGAKATVWLVDDAAAAKLPSDG